MSDVLLVHGTTQSPAGFDTLAAALRERGHHVVRADLPTAEPSWTAERFAEAVAEQHHHELDAPVVVAHSASGLLLPSISAALGARHQVWLAAMVADYVGRQSLLEELRSDHSAVFNSEWIGADPTSDPVLATYFLFHDCDLAGLRAALATVRGCDLRGAYTEVAPHDPRAVPSTYLLPTADRTLRPEYMRHMARRRLGVEPVELPGGHNLYCANPYTVAQAIDAAT
ncbi:alpha/beta fold hydrolase [Sciscionella marina]|uniref:alpha/beta fold hydrolase n=1 Tax=Sciscionella marina TaxID=508770 RepID=UPI00036C86A7|nr:alpha/beta hydrolase [Sciscionella marina]